MSSDKMIESFMSEIDISKTSDRDLENNSFIDMFGNKYNFYTLKDENIVSITFLSDNFDINYYLKLLEELGEKTVVEFSFCDSCRCDKVNEVIDVLEEYPFKNKVFLNVRDVKFSHFDNINFNKLNENTKFTCMGIINEYRNIPIHKECSFEWWFLHNFPNNDEFYQKFGNTTGNKLFELYLMVSMFKIDNSDILNKNIKEKCDRAFLYIKEKFTKKKFLNINKKINNIGSSAIDVYEKMDGDSFGYSSLMKCFLNNQYIGVPCYLVDCDYNGDNHELCQISTLVGDEFYYDLKNNVNGVENLDDRYSSLDFSDIENSKVRERREATFKHGVLIKK